jgi:2-polyprenyl-3-methyl-5-hydroxy-6-metoxy-1,4-benzoquinol methylase
MITSSMCPICSSTNYKLFLELKDHSISKETFQIHQCQTCLLLQTHPIPENMDRYYQSNAYVSHSEKPATIIDRVYFRARTYTLSWKEKLLTRYNSDAKTLLDYGCGTGAFLKYCQTKNWIVTGIEPSDQARRLAKENSNTQVYENIESLDHKQYQVITLWHVLEHLTQLNETLTLLKQKLDKTGTMFIAVPNYKSHDAKHYTNFWAAYDVPRHLWHFSKTTMQQLLRKHGLKTETIIPMKLDAYYVSMLSEKYKHDNNTTIGTLLSATQMGLRSNLNAKKTGEYSSLIYVIKHETI